MSVVAILRAAPILTKEHMLDADSVRHYEVFRTGALKHGMRRGVDADGKDRFDEIPICLDHQKDDVVGVVTHLREDYDVDTRDQWLFAHARIDTSPGWLNTNTNVSVSYRDLGRTSVLGQAWSIVDQGWLTEISLLSPSRDPAHPSARVVWLEERKTPKRAAVKASEAEVIPIRRAARRRPTVIPRDEFDRRWDFAAELEDAGIAGVFEAELEHMQRLERAMQLGRMPPSLYGLTGVR